LSTAPGFMNIPLRLKLRILRHKYSELIDLTIKLSEPYRQFVMLSYELHIKIL